MYDDGLIYRAERMVNWSPGDAQRAVRHRGRAPRGRRRAGVHPLRRRGRRPSSWPPPGWRRCSATPRVAVHPDDERYRHLVGREIELPLTAGRIPGGRRRPRRPGVRHRRGEGHPGARSERLRDRPPARPADADDHGRVRRGSADTGTEFDGMDRFEARVAVREELRAQGRIVAEKRPVRAQRRPLARGPTSRSSRGSPCSGSSRSSRWPRRPGDAVRDGRAVDPPEGDGAALVRLGGQHARLVHLPAAVVGPPDPGLVRPGRRDRLRRAG